MPILRVALDVPVATLFDYRADGVAPSDIGHRVVVPFGKKIAVGIIVEIADSTGVPAARLKQATRVLRDSPALRAVDLQLMRFASDYYHHPLGAVMLAALPARLRRLNSPATGKPRGRFTLSETGAALDPALLPPRAHARRCLLERLREGPLDHATAQALSPQAPRLLRQLVKRGWVKHEPIATPTPTASAPVPAPPLTPDQQRAVAEISASLARFQVHLLLGITGSGKTEVYLHAVAAALGTNRQALLLVPEIALTPQLEALVRARFPGVPAVSLHSGLNESERLAHWLAAQSGRARIVLGTRLAVFTPMAELGIIIVDEEHDASFKQAEGFRYSARDLAVVRAQQCGVPCVLGSATPALETYFNAGSGRYRLSMLGERVASQLPQIECIDTRSERLADGLSRQLLDTIESRRARSEQSLVFINRRGYAPVLMCHSCGWISGCSRCTAQLVLHLKDKRLRCHHCGHQESVPVSCPSCGNPQLAPLGQGTQRVEMALAQLFPAARILRIDRDSVRPRHAWSEMRRRIHQREVDILIGTQILAKGHDFPHLSLVAVLNADSLLYSSDFRASERLFALLTQVAGRAGRGTARGLVLVQTEFPDHPLYQALKRQDYRAFADNLLAERRQAEFPPYVYQALLRAEAPRIVTALGFLGDAVALGRRLARRVTIYDPVPATMPRRAGRERAQLLVQSDSRALLQEFLRAWHGKLAQAHSSQARWSLDVDPLEF
jgi:primosomal protein N' (replication factor Y) (superfamily II helicase)